jgi:orotidine 5'-phosphate decarboxylase subfamily 2
MLGPHGMTALAEVILHARTKGLLVLADGKRGDIGSTAEAYAEGWLAGCWGADALTVNPYLGLDSIEPFVKLAAERNAGIFVLVKTSNPGSKDFQDLQSDGPTNCGPPGPTPGSSYPASANRAVGPQTSAEPSIQTASAHSSSAPVT